MKQRFDNGIKNNKYLGSIDSDEHVVKLDDLLGSGVGLLARELEVLGHFQGLELVMKGVEEWLVPGPC